MGSGYSVVDGNVELSKERMQKLYAKYNDPSAYNVWKKQLEKAQKQQDAYYKIKDSSPKSIFLRTSEKV